MASKLTDAQKGALDTLIALAQEDLSFIDDIVHAVESVAHIAEVAHAVVEATEAAGHAVAEATANTAEVTEVTEAAAAAGAITLRGVTKELRRSKGLPLQVLIDYRNSQD